MDKNKQIKQEDSQSINFDDNYNEEEFLSCQNQDKKMDKLSIMGDFNQVCQKLNYFNEKQEKKQKQNKNSNYVAQYCAKLQEISSPQVKNIIVQKQNNLKSLSIQNYIQSVYTKQNSLNQSHTHLRSSSENNQIGTKEQQNPRLLVTKTHQRNISEGQNIKNTVEVETLQNKRNYFSVEDKKKILQPSKNVSINSNKNQILRKGQSQVLTNNVTMKDYFGQQNSFVNRKVHGKNFINKDSKIERLGKEEKQSTCKVQTPIQKQDKARVKNQNNMKESNLIKTVVQKRSSKEKKHADIEKKLLRLQKPKIILCRKIIDLTQSTDNIIEAFKNEQIKSDYDIFSQSQSTIEEGLFAKAIVNQRATKTVQNVMSPSCNYVQPKDRDTPILKQYAPSHINLNYSPNSLNIYNSIFYKKQNYIR